MRKRRGILTAAITGALALGLGALLRAVLGRPSILDAILGDLVFRCAFDWFARPAQYSSSLLPVASLLILTAAIGATAGSVIGLLLTRRTASSWLPVLITLLLCVLLQVLLRGRVTT